MYQNQPRRVFICTPAIKKIRTKEICNIQDLKTNVTKLQYLYVGLTDNISLILAIKDLKK